MAESSPWTLEIFTDGSVFTNGAAGCGFAYFDEDTNSWHGLAISLGHNIVKENPSLEAEKGGIAFALQYAEKNLVVLCDGVLIRSDCYRAMDQLRSAPSEKWLDGMVRAQIEDLAKIGFEVKMAYVKAHSSDPECEGNRVADLCAKRGAEMAEWYWREGVPQELAKGQEWHQWEPENAT